MNEFATNTIFAGLARCSIVPLLWLASGCGQLLQDEASTDDWAPSASTTAAPVAQQSTRDGDEAALTVWSWSFADIGATGSATGGSGESCAATSDCREDLGLRCVGQRCVQAMLGAEPDPDSDDPVAAGAPRRQGVWGESCESRRDCETGLACITGICGNLPDLASDESDAGSSPVSPALAGVVGETCQAHVDCSEGLSCLERRCTPSDTGLEPSGKECVAIDCREPRDCCPSDTSNCAALQEACAQAEPTSLLCRRFEATCQCDGGNYACDRGSCETLFTCSELVLCPGLMVCDEGSCVRCVSDTDCPGGAKCSANQCAQACERDGECSRFHQCRDGACVDVGCQTDRECKAFLQNPQALCAAGECYSVCASDLECGAQDGSNMICHAGACVDAGCETHQECRLRDNTALGGPVLPGSTTASIVECRERAE